MKISKKQLKQIVNEEVHSVLKDRGVIKEVVDPLSMLGYIALFSFVGMPAIQLGGALGKEYIARKKVKKDALEKLKASQPNVEKIQAIAQKLKQVEKDPTVKKQLDTIKQAGKMGAGKEYLNAYIQKLREAISKLLSPDEQKYLDTVLAYITA